MRSTVLTRLGLGIVVAAAVAGVGVLVHAAPDLAGTTIRISVNAAGSQGDLASFGGDVSATGRYVVFTSRSATLVAGDTNGSTDVFVRDRDTDGNGIFDEPGRVSVVRVNVSTSGEEANAETGNRPAMTPDGRFVAFVSSASNLVDGDRNGLPDVFVRDRDTDADGIFDEPGAVETTRVNLSNAGAEVNDRFGCGSGSPALSASGRFVAFTSSCTSLLPETVSYTHLTLPTIYSV